MDIIKFSWGETYAVCSDFDLNILKSFVKVQEKGNEIFPIANTITIELDKTVNFSTQEKEKIDLKEAEENRDYYQQKYWEEKKNTKKLTEDLDCIEAQLNKLIGNAVITED